MPLYAACDLHANNRFLPIFRSYKFRNKSI